MPVAVYILATVKTICKIVLRKRSGGEKFLAPSPLTPDLLPLKQQRQNIVIGFRVSLDIKA